MFTLKKLFAMPVGKLTDEMKEFIRDNEADATDEMKAKWADVLKAESGESGEESGAESGEESGAEAKKGIDVAAVKKMVGRHMDEKLAKKVDEIAEDIVNKFKAGVEKSRRKVLAGEEAPADKDVNEKVRKFLRAIVSGDVATAKALTTHPSGAAPDDVQTGLLIPAELATELLRVRETGYGIARREFRYLPFSGAGNTRTIPALGSGVTVYWTDEGQKKRSTQPKFSIISQTLKKLTAIVPMTEEILEDAAINITGLIAELIDEAVAREEDLAFFAGTGTPWTGILHNADVVKFALPLVGALNADAFIDMFDELPSGYAVGAKLFINRKWKSKLRKLKSTDGQYIFAGPTGGSPATIWEVPIVDVEALPAPGDVSSGEPFCIYSNLKVTCIFGDKQQVRIKLLTEATVTDADNTTVINLAEQDMVALRFVERVGYVLALPKGVVVGFSGETDES